MGFSTDAIHSGQAPEKLTGAIIPPIFQTSTYLLNKLESNQDFTYSRSNNPTRSALETNIATLENGKHGIAFSSGMAAISAVLGLLKTGDHLIATQNLYGGTIRLIDKVLKNYEIHCTYVDTSNIESIEAAMQPTTRMIYIETPTNPMMHLSPLRTLAGLIENRDILSVVDNTFMTPYFQQPLLLGMDIVLHSTTKYLNGHSDVVSGIAVTSNDEVAEKIRFLQFAAGAVPSPFDCWLILRSVKTLAVRMKAHDKNGQDIARFLSKHPKVKTVYYPGLSTHPQYQLAKEQMSGFGGMLSFDVGSFENAKTVLKNVKLCSLAESLGGVETLISHPSQMTFSSTPKTQKDEMGITDGLIRLSVGIEDIEDIIEDLMRGLDKF